MDSLTDTIQMALEASIRGASMRTRSLLQRVEAEVVAEAPEGFQDGGKSLEAAVVAWRDFHPRAVGPLLMVTRITSNYKKTLKSPNSRISLLYSVCRWCGDGE